MACSFNIFFLTDSEDISSEDDDLPPLERNPNHVESEDGNGNESEDDVPPLEQNPNHIYHEEGSDGVDIEEA